MSEGTGSAEKRLEYLERLVDNLGGAVWEFDWHNAVYTYVSEGAESLLGYRADEWLKPGFWRAHIHPDDVAATAAYSELKTDQLEDHELEYRMMHRDGSVVWVRDIVSVDRERGLDGRLRGILTNISTRKRTEERLRRKAEEFDTVFSAMRDLYARVDADDRVIEYRPPAGTQPFGFPSPQIRPTDSAGLHVNEVVPESLRDMVGRSITLARESGTMVVSDYRYDMRGAERWWEARFVPMDDGGVVIVSRDVTDRRRALDRAERARERYETLVEMSPYAIWVISLSDRCLFANTAARRLLGGSPDADVLGRRIASLIPTDAEGRAETARVMAQLRTWRQGTPAPTTKVMRGRMRTLDGHDVDIERIFAAVPFRGEPAALMLARDVTEEMVSQARTREYETRLTNVIEQAPFGVCLYALVNDELILTGTNGASDEILGEFRRQSIGQPIQRAFPSLETSVVDIFKGLAKDGGTLSSEELTYEDDDCSGVFDVTAFQISPGSIAVTFVDVSTRMAAEESARENRQWLKQAQEIAHLGHYVFRIADDWWDSSAALDGVFGIDEDYIRDFAGWLGVVHPVDRQMMSDYVTQQVLGSGVPFDKEYRIARVSDGATRWVHGLGTLETDDHGNIVQMFGTIHDITDRRLAEDSERKHADRLSAMAAELTITEDRERRRLAEELHDRVSQALAVARMHAGAALAEGVGDGEEEVALTVHLLELAITEARAITTELAPSMLYELGLAPALRWQCDRLGKSLGINTHLVVDDIDESGVDDDAKMVLFRAARELLVNVAKHAGTTEAWLSLDLLPGWLVMTVADKGCGFEPDGGGAGNGDSGFGLFSIRDRLPHLGGVFEIESAPGEGTQVTLRVPRSDS